MASVDGEMRQQRTGSTGQSPRVKHLQGEQDQWQVSAGQVNEEQYNSSTYLQKLLKNNLRNSSLFSDGLSLVVGIAVLWIGKPKKTREVKGK